MTAAALRVLAQEREVVNELPVPPIVFGVGAFTLLVILLLITMQFNKDR